MKLLKELLIEICVGMPAGRSWQMKHLLLKHLPKQLHNTFEMYVDLLSASDELIQLLTAFAKKIKNFRPKQGQKTN